MSPRAWVASATRAQKAVGALAGTLVLCASAWVTVSGFLALPGRVDAMEARVDVLESSDADGARWRAETDRRLEWVVCDGMVRQGIPYHGRRTQQECAADFILTGSKS